jgi:catechol 2,3-dioxygenase-like lactoylglutathione lyase family enzyme
MNRLITLALAGVALATAPAKAQGPEFASALEFSPFMVAISVDDMAAETAFYVDVLDFRVERDASMRDGAVQFRWLTNGTQRIELVKVAGSVPGADHPPPPGHAGVRGFTHLTLETADIANVRNVLATRGIVPVLEPTDVAALGIRVMYLLDPEGNAVEIAQVTGG